MPTFVFDGFEADASRFELRRELEVLAVEPQVLEVLLHLLEHRDRIVSKEELLDVIWGDRFVSESALSSRIASARRAIGDNGSDQRLIRTVHGRGFRFVGSVREVPDTRPASAGSEISQRMRYCHATDGVRLAYATVGEGAPLVKAANWLTHLRDDWESIVWKHWLRDLSQRRRLIHYDERGSGMSDWEVEAISFDAWVRDLGTVVDDVGVDRFALLGISQGAAVAVSYAAQHPDRVSHLVLYGGFALGRNVRARTAHERREAAMMLDIVESGWGDDTSAFRQMFATQFMPEGTPEQWAAFDAHQRSTASAENARRLLTVSAQIDVTDIAPHITTPTLVLHAAEDRRVPVAQGELLAALIPGARFVSLPSCNHLLLDGEPSWAQFLTEIDRFLAS